jgi:hypothetical protein
LGHYNDFCPELTGQQHAKMADITLDPDSDSDYESICADFIFAHQFTKHSAEHQGRVLLDSGSSCSVFCDDSFLTNIQQSEHTLKAFTNGGSQESTYRGDLGGFFRVWYNPESLINILSWSEVASQFRITTDSAIDDSIFIHIADGITIRFNCINEGIYLLDETDLPKLKPLIGYTCANVVEHNKLDFTNRELEGANTARSLFKALGMPSYSRYIHAIENNLIQDCPVTISDVRRALHIYGPEMATIKGKTTRKKPISLPESTFTPIPKSLLDHHKQITIAIDFFLCKWSCFPPFYFTWLQISHCAKYHK